VLVEHIVSLFRRQLISGILSEGWIGVAVLAVQVTAMRQLKGCLKRDEMGCRSPHDFVQQWLGQLR
jgi:hypothetical protein